MEPEVPQDHSNKMYFYKLHETKFGTLIAVCDKELSGKILKDGDIEFFVNPRFYGETKIGDEVLSLIKQSNDGNIVGNNIIKLLLKNKLIPKKSVMKIDGVSHAQFSVL